MQQDYSSFYTPGEVLRILGIEDFHLATWCSRGVVPYMVKPGGTRRLFSWEQLCAMAILLELERQGIPPRIGSVAMRTIRGLGVLDAQIVSLVSGGVLPVDGNITVNQMFEQKGYSPSAIVVNVREVINRISRFKK